MLNPKTFVCNRKCGECCIKLIIKLNNADIKKIKSAGYEEEQFLDADPFLPGPSKHVMLKQQNGWCVFLKKNKQGEFSCKIYNERPQVCRDYPFSKEKLVDDCRPKGFMDYLKERCS